MDVICLLFNILALRELSVNQSGIIEKAYGGHLAHGGLLTF